MNITHDFHIHSHLSLCAHKSATAEAYAKIFKEQGIKKAGFSDHFWDDTYENSHAYLLDNTGQHNPKGFYIPQNYEYLCQLKPELSAVDFGDTEIFFGCETDYDPVNRRPAITPETAEKFDFVLMPNSHTHMVMPIAYYEPYEKHIDYMIQIYEDTLNSDVAKYITSMAHPFEAVCCLYDYNILMRMITDDTLKRLFSKTAEKGIAIEVNVSCMKGKTPEEIADLEEMRLYRIAKDEGCLFTFGSDSHDDLSHKYYSNATLVANLLNLTEKDLHPLVR